MAINTQIILLYQPLKWVYFQKCATEDNNYYQNIIIIIIIIVIIIILYLEV